MRHGLHVRDEPMWISDEEIKALRGAGPLPDWLRAPPPQQRARHAPAYEGQQRPDDIYDEMDLRRETYGQTLIMVTSEAPAPYWAYASEHFATDRFAIQWRDWPAHTPYVFSEKPHTAHFAAERIDQVMGWLHDLEEEMLEQAVLEAGNYMVWEMVDACAVLCENPDHRLLDAVGADTASSIVAELADAAVRAAVHTHFATLAWAGVDDDCVKADIETYLGDTPGSPDAGVPVDARVEDFDVFYEHSGWFVTHLPSGAQWSAHDVGTASSIAPTGWVFERVSDGDLDE